MDVIVVGSLQQWNWCIYLGELYQTIFLSLKPRRLRNDVRYRLQAMFDIVFDTLQQTSNASSLRCGMLPVKLTHER